MSQTLDADETKLAPPVRTRKGTNEGFLSDAVVRSRVVLEILSTERDYVKNLQDVVEVRESLVLNTRDLRKRKIAGELAMIFRALYLLLALAACFPSLACWFRVVSPVTCFPRFIQTARFLTWPLGSVFPHFTLQWKSKELGKRWENPSK